MVGEKQGSNQDKPRLHFYVSRIMTHKMSLAVFEPEIIKKAAVWLNGTVCMLAHRALLGTPPPLPPPLYLAASPPSSIMFCSRDVEFRVSNQLQTICADHASVSLDVFFLRLRTCDMHCASSLRVYAEAGLRFVL